MSGIMLVDKELIKGLRKKDSQAFATVYKAYYNYIYYFIKSIVKEDSLSEDITQDTFIKMIENISSLKKDSSFHSYIITIAKNLSFNHLKRDKENLFEDMDVVSKSNDKYSFAFEEIHDYLTKEENTIVIYRLIYDLSFKEISLITQVPIASIHRK